MIRISISTTDEIIGRRMAQSIINFGQICNVPEENERRYDQERCGLVTMVRISYTAVISYTAAISTTRHTRGL